MSKKNNNYDSLPADLRPISPWRYFGLSIVYAIPVIGFIVLIVNSLSKNNNVNVRNFSRSFFCALILVLIVAGILAAIGLAGDGIDKIKQLIGNM